MLDSSSCKYTCPEHRTTGVLLPTLILLTQFKYEKFEFHGEDVKLLFAGASLRFNNPTTATKFHTTLTAAFHWGMQVDNGAQYLA